jgi:hypothetical protein
MLLLALRRRGTERGKEVLSWATPASQVVGITFADVLTNLGIRGFPAHLASRGQTRFAFQCKVCGFPNEQNRMLTHGGSVMFTAGKHQPL